MNYPNKVIIIDLETTGLSPQYDCITQIGAVVMEDGDIVGVPFYHRIRPGDKMKISIEALKAQLELNSDPEHDGLALGKWYEGMMKAESSADVAAHFAEWIKDKLDLPMVAHNASFDSTFLNSWQYQQRTALKYVPFGQVVICTMQMAKLIMPGGGSYGLDVVLALLGKPPRPSHHDALQDAILTGTAYFELVSVHNKTK